MTKERTCRGLIWHGTHFAFLVMVGITVKRRDCSGAVQKAGRAPSVWAIEAKRCTCYLAFCAGFNKRALPCGSSAGSSRCYLAAPHAVMTCMKKELNVMLCFDCGSGEQLCCGPQRCAVTCPAPPGAPGRHCCRARARAPRCAPRSALAGSSGHHPTRGFLSAEVRDRRWHLCGSVCVGCAATRQSCVCPLHGPQRMMWGRDAQTAATCGSAGCRETSAFFCLEQPRSQIAGNSRRQRLRQRSFRCLLPVTCVAKPESPCTSGRSTPVKSPPRTALPATPPRKRVGTNLRARASQAPNVTLKLLFAASSLPSKGGTRRS